MSATPSSMDVAVPEAAVLLGERDQRAVGAGAGRAPRVGQQHEREQPGDLAVVGQQRVHRRGSAGSPRA